MPKIGITLEITKRLYREYEVTDEELEAMKDSYCLSDAIGAEAYMEFRDDVENDGDYDVDFAVTDEDGITIIDWD